MRVEGRRCDGEAAGRGERGNVYVEPLAGEELYCLVRLLDGWSWSCVVWQETV